MSGQATLARSASGSASGSNSAMNARKGTNTSVSSNRMASHQTPRSGTFNAAILQSRAAVSKGKNGNITAKGTLIVYSRGYANFKAPANMPGRLNNTAAAAVTSKRVKSVGIGVGTFVAPFGTPAGALTYSQGAMVGGRQNNYASLRLKASGYKVAGTGFKGNVKPASKNVQVRAAATLSAKEAKLKSKGVKSFYTETKVLDRNTGLIAKAPAVITMKDVNAGAKAKAASGGKGAKGKSGSGGQKTGRKNFRPRRDGNGKFAGSY